MLDTRIVTPAVSACFFPVDIASNKDWSSTFCIDYRPSNKKMKLDKWPLPCTVYNNYLIVLLVLAGSLQWIHFMATNRSNWPNKIKENSTFIWKYGTHQFEIMPFGLKKMHHLYFSKWRAQYFPSLRSSSHIKMRWSFSQMHLKAISIISIIFSEYLPKMAVMLSYIVLGTVKHHFTWEHFWPRRGESWPRQIFRHKKTPITVSKTWVRRFLELAGHNRILIRSLARISAPYTPQPRKMSFLNGLWRWTTRSRS